ncbi:hypothetical protein GJ744_011815 [Endocarpon pusillum]|uniref:Methyltransferase domain-containing protein n=1 Tax=Endocarpon pusillum TaxID=364733 RepID=A0A8H7E0R7_9EURO|nr:hypothetical protein GJ744_011815 [Endocarpon pusillum]
MNHQTYTLLQGNRLLLAPITPTSQKILDLGRGTGIFAIDIADMYPSAKVIGTDIAPVQLQWVPTNCQFEIEDAEDDWTFQKNDFDYIHGRDFYQSIRDWRRLVQQSYNHLKPGGYLELSCVYLVPGCDDETLPQDCAYVEVCQTFQAIGAKMEADPDAPLQFHEHMREAGFANLSQTVLEIPTSSWPKDRRLKNVGALELMNLMEGAQGFLLRGNTKEFGRTREELELLLMRMRKELTRQKYCRLDGFSKFDPATCG